MEEVNEIAEEHKTLSEGSADALISITANYDSHHDLDQALTHVEHSFTDLEDRVQALGNEKADPEDMNKSLQVCST